MQDTESPQSPTVTLELAEPSHQNLRDIVDRLRADAPEFVQCATTENLERPEHTLLIRAGDGEAVGVTGWADIGGAPALVWPLIVPAHQGQGYVWEAYRQARAALHDLYPRANHLRELIPESVTATLRAAQLGAMDMRRRRDDSGACTTFELFGPRQRWQHFGLPYNDLSRIVFVALAEQHRQWWDKLWKEYQRSDAAAARDLPADAGEVAWSAVHEENSRFTGKTALDRGRPVGFALLYQHRCRGERIRTAHVLHAYRQRCDSKTQHHALRQALLFQMLCAIGDNIWSRMAGIGAIGSTTPSGSRAPSCCSRCGESLAVPGFPYDGATLGMHRNSPAALHRDRIKSPENKGAARPNQLESSIATKVGSVAQFPTTPIALATNERFEAADGPDSGVANHREILFRNPKKEP